MQSLFIGQIHALSQEPLKPVEQEGARQAHIRDGVALTRFFAWFQAQTQAGKPLKELDVVDKLRALRQENALYKDDSFPAITGFGAHGAIIHYKATPETNISIDLDNLLLIDSGAQYLDGTTDVTRTIAVGLPSTEHKDRFTKVLKGHIALAMAQFPKEPPAVSLIHSRVTPYGKQA